MNFIAPRADTAVPHIQEIPLSRLALAPENVRKTPPDPQADAEIKASIAALGLLENLVVRPDEPGEDGTERYTVVAGGRRLRAMRELAADGVLDAAHPVPCQIRSGEIEPAELSLAENVVRIAMHPADQVVAFSKLVQAGQPVSSIAARFGVSERMVEQRLPVLLEKLAMAKLQAAADELATRWKWATAMIEVDWNDTARYGRIEPQPADPSPEEQAEIDRLQTRHDELVNLDDGDWTEDLVAEGERIEARLDEIEAAIEARAVFRREDLRLAGCIVTVGRDGAMQLIQGLVKPEDMPKPAESSDVGTTTGNGHDAAAGTHRVHVPEQSVAAPMAPPKDRGAEARKEAGVGIGLADDLRSIRTALVKAKLAGDFEAAFDLALFQMGRAVFAPGYRDHALDIAVKETPDRPNTRMNDADFADRSPGEAMLEDRSHLSMDWLEIEDDGESFAALRALPQADKEALFAACVARTVKGQLAFEPHPPKGSRVRTLPVPPAECPPRR